MTERPTLKAFKSGASNWWYAYWTNGRFNTQPIPDGGDGSSQLPRAWQPCTIETKVWHQQLVEWAKNPVPIER